MLWSSVACGGQALYVVVNGFMLVRKQLSSSQLSGARIRVAGRSLPRAGWDRPKHLKHPFGIKLVPDQADLQSSYNTPCTN